jgi:hypothetical protein
MTYFLMVANVSAIVLKYPLAWRTAWYYKALRLSITRQQVMNDKQVRKEWSFKRGAL